jgi:Leucine-rich repeat (LRR) protein
MPRLRALIVINCSTSTAMLRNFSVFSNLSTLRSLWLEKVSVTQLNDTTIPLKNLRKISLILCKLNNRLEKSMVDLPHIFPCLSELAIDHCDDLTYMPSSTSQMKALKRLSITNCHSLTELPADLGELKSLEILRLYACPELKTLPPSICELVWLKYLDISQCVKLKLLPGEIGKLAKLEKIDMRECPALWNVPKSALSLESIRRVICDEEVSWQWEDLKSGLPNLSIQVAQKSFDLDWLYE